MKSCPFVVMFEEIKNFIQQIEISFCRWWFTVPDVHKVNVRYPFERHGLAGTPSNNARTRNLEFVDNNSQTVVT